MSGWITVAYDLPEEEEWRWEAIPDARPDLASRTVMHSTEIRKLWMPDENAVQVKLAVHGLIDWMGDHFVVPDYLRSEVENCLSDMSCQQEWRVERIAEFDSEEVMREFDEAMISLLPESLTCDTTPMVTQPLPERRPGG